MNDDLAKMLGSLIQNPDAIKSLAGSIGLPQQAESPSTETSSNMEMQIKNMMNALNQTDDRRISLLNALRPYLSPQRASGVDRAIRLLKLSKLSQFIRNEGE